MTRRRILAAAAGAIAGLIIGSATAHYVLHVDDRSPAQHVLVITTTSTSSTTSSTTSTSITPTPTTTTIVPTSIEWPWNTLADCESGTWDDTKPHGVVAGSRNWADRTPLYEGGLHFTPDTWTSYRPAGYPAAADAATAAQQVTVAERVLAAQGWDAWPSCSRRIGAQGTAPTEGGRP